MPTAAEDHAKRIWRLELGLCGAFVAIAAGGFALYDKVDGTAQEAKLQVANVSGDVRVLDERTASMDKKLDKLISRDVRKP